jgi:hypothetical protein
MSDEKTHPHPDPPLEGEGKFIERAASDVDD